MPDNVGEMFYYGDTPWHKKGIQLKQPATAEQAIKAGGLDWRVRLVPIQTDERLPRNITRRMAVVRDDLKPGDPNAVLGVVYPHFRPLQNREAVEVFDTLLGRGQRVYHTGGYLGNGEVIWLLAQLPASITVAAGDVVEPYMLLTNSNDGTIAIDFRLTTVRVICQNTLALAMRGDQSSHIFKRAHKVSPETLKVEGEKFYQFCVRASADLETKFRAMHSLPFGRDQLAGLVADLLPLPRPPAEETLWGALNAVTAFVDHKQEINGDRYGHILFGSGATLKQKAYELALAQLPKN